MAFLKWREWVQWKIGKLEEQANINRTEVKKMGTAYETLLGKLQAEHDAVNAKLAALKEQIGQLPVGEILTEEQVTTLVAIIDDTTQDTEAA